MVFPYEKFLTDNLKTYGLMDPANFLENVFIGILKNVMPAVPFSVTTNFCPYLSLRRLQGDSSNLKHFKKRNGTVGSTIQKL